MHPSKRKHTRKKHKNLRRCVWITNSFSMSQILNGMRFWKNKTFMRYMVGLDLKMPNSPKFSGQRWWVFCSSRKWLDLLGKQVVYRFQVLFFDEKISRVSTKKNTIIWPKNSKIFIQVKLDGWLPVPHGLLTKHHQVQKHLVMISKARCRPSCPGILSFPTCVSGNSVSSQSRTMAVLGATTVLERANAPTKLWMLMAWVAMIGS